MSAELAALHARKAALLRELAEVEEAFVAALEAARPAAPADEVLTLGQAAALLGEPERTVRARLEYRKALVSRPREHRLRFSRRELERIRRDRLAGNSS